MSFEQLIRDIKEKKFKPLYLIQGEEEYYIDLLLDALEKNVLTEEEKGFNQTVLYGNETNFEQLIEAAKRYPMMAERQLIIVKEAQNLKKFDEFENYLENPTPTTILVLGYKHGRLDARKKASKLIKKNGIVFTSERLKEYQVPQWIKQQLESNQYKITPKATALLVEFLGVELSKIANEVSKLMLNLSEGTTINDHHIQEFVGINKDFNFFELQNAIIAGDRTKAVKIANYFGKSQKQHPFPVTIIMLLNFHVTLLKYHFTKPKDRNSDRLPRIMGVPNFYLKDYIKAAKVYNGKVVFRNIGLLRKYDMMSKGKGTTISDPAALLKELIPRLMTT